MMAIFDFIKRKKSLLQFFPTGLSIYIPMQAGQATARDFKQLAVIGYAKNMTVYACVRTIASAVAGLDVTLYRQKKNGIEEIETHDILDLLQKPGSDFVSGANFLEAIAINLLLAGNAYILKLRVGERGKPVSLTLLRPDLVQVHWSNEIDYYEYASSKKYDPADVIHIREYNPLNPFLGLSRLRVAEMGIEADNEAHIWNLKLLRNNMRLEGVFKVDQKLTEQQLEALQKRLENYEGALNAGKAMVLQAGMDWKQMSISPKDMDWINAIKQNRREICAVFGVPPELLGDAQQKTYSNYKEARRAFYQETVIPFAQLLFAGLTKGLASEWGDDLVIDFDRDAIDALQEDRAEQYNYLNTAWWLSVNEKREATKYSNVPGGDQIMIPANLVATLSTNEKPSPDDVLSKQQNLTLVNKQSPAIINYDISRWRKKEERDSLWYSYYDRVKAKEKDFIPTLEKFLEEQTKRIMQRLKELGTVRMISRAPELLPVKDEAKKYQQATEQIYLKHFAHGYKAGISATKGALYEYQEKGVLDEMTDEEAEELAHLIFDSGTKISQTTLERIKDKIIRADQENWTTEQLTQAIWESEGIFAPWRARMIARTESAKVENWAQLEGYKETEFVDGKGWLSARIKTSRDEHIEAADRYEDNPIRLDEKFLVGGEELEYPGDPAGSPGNVINCLCSIFPAVLK
jgi:HK97 family phage portal protein